MSIQSLEKYLPQNTFKYLRIWFSGYYIHIKVTRNRNSKLGDYRKLPDNSHEITVNSTLTPQLFFFVLTHELAHLIAFETLRFCAGWSHRFFRWPGCPIWIDVRVPSGRIPKPRAPVGWVCQNANQLLIGFRTDCLCERWIILLGRWGRHVPMVCLRHLKSMRFLTVPNPLISTWPRIWNQLRCAIKLDQ